MSQIQQYCTFYLGGNCLGVDVLRVQEVLRSQEMTPVPRAPEDVLGLINLRGQIVTAVDLKRRLSMDSKVGEQSMNVIVRTPDGPVSLLVDSIGDVIEVDSSTLESTPDTVAPSARRFLAGVHKLDRALLAVLDVDKLCASTNEVGC